MKFFKKRGVAITITILLIVVALVIGFSGNTMKKEYAPQSQSASQQWAKENYEDYAEYTLDEAGLFSEIDTLPRIWKYNAQLDYRYGSILGVLTVNGLDGMDIADYAYEAGGEMGLGVYDLLLLIDAQSRDWYVQPGEQMAYYLDHELELTFREYMEEDDLFTGEADEEVLDLYEDLTEWYEDHMPLANEEMVEEYHSYESGMGGLFVLLIVVLFIVILINAASRRHYYTTYHTGGSGFWRGMFWGSMFSNRHYHHHHHTPPPPHTHRPTGFTSHTRPGANRSARPGGGFGGSSRGGFGGGSRGGFGGGSRGGFGGGRGGRR